ncbi:hypothetical protein YSY43_05980 [Paenibacillus sp. YSY-4.3]
MLGNNIVRKILPLALSISIVMPLSGVHGQTMYSDIQGHWAETQLNSWISQGLIKGYTDGTLKPNNVITRGEFMALVNRSFQIYKTSSISFKDLKTSDWVYTDVQKAIEAGYIMGYEDQTIRSSAPLSRQEAAVIVAQLLNLPDEELASNVFKDASTIASWSKGAVGAAASKNIVSGYVDRTFKPKANITRAEAVVMLEKVRNLKLNELSEQLINEKPSLPESTETTSSETPAPSTSSESPKSWSPNPSYPPLRATTGVSGTTLITVPGTESTAGVKQEITLPIISGAADAGTIRVTFTDGTVPVFVDVTLIGTEIAEEVAAKITAAFGSSIPGWDVTTNEANVLFTASVAALNNPNVTAVVEDLGTGVGALSSLITTLGNDVTAGTAQVVTLEIENGATGWGTIYARFTDGNITVNTSMSIVGTETAFEIAENIATGFGTSISGWDVTAVGTKVLFTAQTPAINNPNVGVRVLEPSGVGAPVSTITTLGDLASNTAQVVTLRLQASQASGGPVSVKFTDGVSTVIVDVMMLDFPETGAQLADKIAAAFGNSIPGWSVTSNYIDVVFTANMPADNNEKAVAKFSGAMTGVGMPDSIITTEGDPTPTGTSQVVTLEIPNGSTGAGSLKVKFTDGITPAYLSVPLTGVETAAEVAAKIADTFGSSFFGWKVVPFGTSVVFTAPSPAANNPDVEVTVAEFSSGVVASASMITTLGADPNIGNEQIATLTIEKAAKAAGTIRVTFTDGTTPVHVNVKLSGTETTAEVASKIAAAFGTTITGWDVMVIDSNVHFIASTPAENNTNVNVIIQE